LFVKEFERLVPQGQTILCIHPSAEVSGTVRSAQVAAQEFPNADIRVIDSRTIGSPLATLVQLAAEWANSGLNANAMKNTEADDPAADSFSVSTLNTLPKVAGLVARRGVLLQPPIWFFAMAVTSTNANAPTAVPWPASRISSSANAQRWQRLSLSCMPAFQMNIRSGRRLAHRAEYSHHPNRMYRPPSRMAGQASCNAPTLIHQTPYSRAGAVLYFFWTAPGTHFRLSNLFDQVLAAPFVQSA
jgi:hypothetical protein